MKVKYIIRLALINLSARKIRSAISILLMTAALTILIITLSLSSSMTSYIDRNLANNIGCRTLFVFYDFQAYSEEGMIDKVSKYNHIVGAYPQGALSQGLTISTLIGKVQLSQQEGGSDGQIHIRGGNKKVSPDIIAGRNFKDGETNVAIIPEKFLPDSRVEILNDNKERYNFIGGKSLLGKTLTGKTEANKDYTFTVIGVYDSSKSMDKENSLYIPYDDMSAIYKTLNIVKSKHSNYPIIAVVDNYKKVSAVMDELFKDGMRPSVKFVLNTELPVYINIVGGVFSIGIFIVALINISLTTVNSVKDRTQEIGVLKAIGYSNKTILAMLNIETLIIGIIGFILALVLATLAIMFISTTSTDANLLIAIKPLNSLIALIVSIVVPAIACILAEIKIAKIQPSSAMKE